MLYAEIIFTPKKKTPGAKAKLLDAVYGLLASLMKNYQIADNQVLGWVRENLQVAVQVPRPDSLALKYFSPWALEAWERLKLLCSGPPECKEIEDQVKKNTSWKKEQSFYFMTTIGELSSPIRAGSNGSPIPPYLLPLEAKVQESIYYWQSSHQMFDTLWLRSGELEIPAWRQMVDPASEHAKEGRKLCHIIEEATTIPTYYI